MVPENLAVTGATSGSAAGKLTGASSGVRPIVWPIWVLPVKGSLRSDTIVAGTSVGTGPIALSSTVESVPDDGSEI